MRKIELPQPNEYGDRCLDLAYAIVDKDLPAIITNTFFARANYLESLKNLSRHIASRYWFNLFGKSPDLLSQLQNYANPKVRNCRLSTLLMGIVLTRDHPENIIKISNVSFDPSNPDHSVLLIDHNAEAYMVQFMAGGVGRAEMRIFNRSTYNSYDFDATGLYLFDHERGKV